jgi:hypothetical protein
MAGASSGVAVSPILFVARLFCHQIPPGAIVGAENLKN